MNFRSVPRTYTGGNNDIAERYNNRSQLIGDTGMDTCHWICGMHSWPPGKKSVIQASIHIQSYAFVKHLWKLGQPKSWCQLKLPAQVHPGEGEPSSGYLLTSTAPPPKRGMLKKSGSKEIRGLLACLPYPVLVQAMGRTGVTMPHKKWGRIWHSSSSVRIFFLASAMNLLAGLRQFIFTRLQYKDNDICLHTLSCKDYIQKVHMEPIQKSLFKCQIIITRYTGTPKSN